MIILIGGASHTGKTALAQRLLKKYNYTYLSIDHLKMGLIRSGNTSLTPLSDDKLLTDYLWPIVREMIKTAIENNQNLIVEGCYIPFNWQMDFDREYLKKIKYCCLIMSRTYIENHIDDIKKYANIVENRLCDDINTQELIDNNLYNLQQVKKRGLNYILFDDEYMLDINFPKGACAIEE